MEENNEVVIFSTTSVLCKGGKKLGQPIRFTVFCLYFLV
jgi:hypothetical protein